MSTLVTRVRYGVWDGWTMTRRYLTHVVRSPEEIAIYFSVPLLFVLVFGYVLSAAMVVPDGGDYREFLLPGVFVMSMVYGLGATAIAVATDVGRGVVDRFRALPVARSALLVGRGTADLLRAVLEVTVLVGCGVLIGWRVRGSVAETAAAVALLLWLRFALSWVGIWLGLRLRNPDLVGVIVFPLAFPLTALSNILVAPELMPGWVGTVAEWNPLSATAAAARELFGNPGAGGETWPAQHPVLLAALWPLLLVMVFTPLAVRQYRGWGIDPPSAPAVVR
ncbi:MAG TPA: ABC transporter permease [Natronosporangium sp.]|nr:ABC transporter permease [Natronosporangium sp.]